jgi:hypothetical protein
LGKNKSAAKMQLIENLDQENKEKFLSWLVLSTGDLTRLRKKSISLQTMDFLVCHPKEISFFRKT